MARDLDKSFVITGILSTTILVFVFTLVQLIVSPSVPTFEGFAVTEALLNFIFILGAVLLSFTSYTETTRKAFISTVILTLISIVIYNVLVGGTQAIYSTTNPVISLLNWLIDIALTFGVISIVYYLKQKWKP